MLHLARQFKDATAIWQWRCSRKYLNQKHRNHWVTEVCIPDHCVHQTSQLTSPNNTCSHGISQTLQQCCSYAEQSRKCMESNTSSQVHSQCRNWLQTTRPLRMYIMSQLMSSRITWSLAWGMGKGCHSCNQSWWCTFKMYIFHATTLFSQRISTNLFNCIIYLLISSLDMFRPDLMGHLHGNLCNMFSICSNLSIRLLMYDLNWCCNSRLRLKYRKF
jgi:hypothetical protein